MASFVSSTSESILLSLSIPCSARGICWLTSTFSFNSLFAVVLFLLFLPFHSAFQLFSPSLSLSSSVYGTFVWQRMAWLEQLWMQHWGQIHGSQQMLSANIALPPLSGATVSLIGLGPSGHASVFTIILIRVWTFIPWPSRPPSHLLSPATPMQIHSQVMWPFRQHGYLYPYGLINVYPFLPLVLHLLISHFVHLFVWRIIITTNLCQRVNMICRLRVWTMRLTCLPSNFGSTPYDVKVV